VVVADELNSLGALHGFSSIVPFYRGCLVGRKGVGAQPTLGGYVKMASMEANQYKAANPSGQAVTTMKKRMPGYHRFEFFRPGWFIAGILFLPLLLLLAWGVIGILRLFGLL
jgi:hypothetical protein